MLWWKSTSHVTCYTSRLKRSYEQCLLDVRRLNTYSSGQACVIPLHQSWFTYSTSQPSIDSTPPLLPSPAPLMVEGAESWIGFAVMMNECVCLTHNKVIMLQFSSGNDDSPIALLWFTPRYRHIWITPWTRCHGPYCRLLSTKNGSHLSHLSSCQGHFFYEVREKLTPASA